MADNLIPLKAQDEPAHHCWVKFVSSGGCSTYKIHLPKGKAELQGGQKNEMQTIAKKIVRCGLGALWVKNYSEKADNKSSSE